jgi:hypothetical protein
MEIARFFKIITYHFEVFVYDKLIFDLFSFLKL